MKRTLRVTGKGCLSVAPDTIRVLLTLSDVETEYAAALKTSTESTETLKQVIGSSGFDANDLKTLSFDVNVEYKSYLDKRTDTWENKPIGYRCTHRMKLEFPLDNQRLGTLLFALSSSGLRPEIDIEHTVADPEAVRNRLIAAAVEDSQAKAKVLSKSAGVALKGIVLIDYSRSSIDIVSHPMNACLDAMCETQARKAAFSVDITPDDIRLDDNVTVVWEIE